MFTGSADQHSGIEESGVRVAVPQHAPPPRRSGGTEVGGSVDLLDLLDPTDPALGEPDTGWTAEAACKGRTSLFFGIAGERPERRVRRERTARDVCDGCSVVAPCRDRARKGRENGFWGGESEEERAAAGFPPRSISRRSVQQASSVRAEAS